MKVAVIHADRLHCLDSPMIGAVSVESVKTHSHRQISHSADSLVVIIQDADIKGLVPRKAARRVKEQTIRWSENINRGVFHFEPYSNLSH